MTRTERLIIAREAELEYIYELVEASALTAHADDIATLFARSREIVAEIAALKREAA
ncbi:hypothetical protein [Sphingomonas sp.]|uniref:hypothetical protein n=1 Tax=Sphingomonas sp. TaxID=28214 RepID=UPI0025D29823|nr:hypothetical protein [Sphingomonas sp.]